MAYQERVTQREKSAGRFQRSRQGFKKSLRRIADQAWVAAQPELDNAWDELRKSLDIAVDDLREGFDKALMCVLRGIDDAKGSLVKSGSIKAGSRMEQA